VLIQAKKLGNQTSCAISDDGAMMKTPTANHGETRDFGFQPVTGGEHQDGEKRVPSSFAALLEEVEFSAVLQFIAFPQSDAPTVHRDLSAQITVKRLRPFALRRARTLRPPLVAILARKPYFLARLITEG